MHYNWQVTFLEKYQLRTMEQLHSMYEYIVGETRTSQKAKCELSEIEVAEFRNIITGLVGLTCYHGDLYCHSDLAPTSLTFV